MSNTPFSAHVLEAEYFARGDASFPFSSHSAVHPSFQVASETVTGTSEAARIATQDDVTTMRRTEDLARTRNSQNRTKIHSCVQRHTHILKRWPRSLGRHLPQVRRSLGLRVSS